MKSLSDDFINTAEQVNIWMFLSCVLVAVGCMFPEVIWGPTEFNVWLSFIANGSMIALCVLWLVTQSLWFVVRKFAERRETLATA